MKRTVDGEVDDLAESCPDSIDGLAQVVALVVLLHPGENQRAVRVYFEIVAVLVGNYVLVVAGLVAARLAPGHARRRKTVRVAVQRQPGHALGGVHVLGLGQPTWWHYSRSIKYQQRYLTRLF